MSECNWNLKLLKSDADRSRENKEEGNPKTTSSARFRQIANELLVTNRYVDEDEVFFVEAEICWTLLNSMNEKLSLWDNSCASVDEFILNREEDARKIIENFKAKVEAARDKLSKRF